MLFVGTLVSIPRGIVVLALLAAGAVAGLDRQALEHAAVETGERVEIGSGRHKATLQMIGGSPMPYSVEVAYHAEQPANAEACPLRRRVRYRA